MRSMRELLRCCMLARMAAEVQPPLDGAQPGMPHLELRVDSEVALAARREWPSVTANERATGDEVLRWVERSAYADLCSDDEFAAAWEHADRGGAGSLDRAGYEAFVEAVDSFAKRRVAREPPSLGNLVKGMLKSPSMRKMVTKMAVGVAEHGGLLGPGEERLRIDGGGGASAAAEEMEREMDELMQSAEFGDLMDRVVESPGMKRVLRTCRPRARCRRRASSWAR